MNEFNYFQPTEIVFGKGSIDKLGEIAKKYGCKCLLVTTSASGAVKATYEKVFKILDDAGIEYKHFDKVIPNPTTDVVTAGTKLALDIGAEFIIGLGGGSSMDTAKAIAVEATHEGTAWDYLHYKKQPTDSTLPIIAISTTSGTGSQTTPCSVITKTDVNDKSAIWHKNIFPKVALIDPELIVSLPSYATAQTGFDAFAHNFEAYISVNSNPYVESLAIDAIKRIVKYLPIAVNDTKNIEAREALAWADTVGGLCISSSGVTLPHGLGMQISGHCPHVSHGLSLAVTYSEFTRYTYKSSIEKFAKVGRIFNSVLNNLTDEMAAESCCEEIDLFMKKIGLWTDFKTLKVSKEEIEKIAECGQVLGDYQNNPRVATMEEMHEILMKSYEKL